MATGGYLERLEPRHLAAARMRVEGKDNDYIAKELAVRKPTLYKWFSDPLVKTEVQRLLDKADELFAERLVAAGMTGIEALVDMVQKPAAEGSISDHMRLEVVRELLDRLPQTSKVRDRAPEAGDVAQFQQFIAVFQNMPNERLAAFLNNWDELDGAADVDAIAAPAD